MEHAKIYLSAKALKISEEERTGLIALSHDLAQKDYSEVFNMADWCCCIRGKLEDKLGKESRRSSSLTSLYSGGSSTWCHDGRRSLIDVTPLEASEAIQNFLLGIKANG